ncbi:cytochrome P450 [Butyriboletus roseoflavus]|nr:cytochrome P450 [Butyriboletus roseoflavus]
MSAGGRKFRSTSLSMISPLLEPPAGIFGCLVVATALIFVVKWSQSSKLDRIPTVGLSSWLGSWLAGFKYQTNAPDILQEGYEKHNSAPFKMAELHRWTVILSSREHVEELRRTPEDTLSFTEAKKEAMQGEHTLGPEIYYNPYHIPIMISQLTRNIGALYPEIRDEITMAFDDVLDLTGNEWKSVLALRSMQKVVCRTSNRIFVGLPLCRDPDWIDLNIQYTLDVVKGAAIIRRFPQLLKPIAARLFTSVYQNQRRGRELLGPIIEERQKYLNECGDEWADKPNDFLSWLMEEAEGSELTIERLTTRILLINFAAIHTSSQSFTHVLFYLAANRQYIQPLREEVERIIKKEGWSKAALGKMRKVDSFIKECQRLEGIPSVSLIRKAMKDFTFSDGTFVPKGTSIVAAARSIHYDEAFYENAHAFEPFRFADLREQDGEDVKHQFVSTTTEYLSFGHGRRACPGRFFAANELKSMLVHVVMTYDVKLADDAMHPPTLYFGMATLPEPSAKVMFKRRVD